MKKNYYLFTVVVALFMLATPSLRAQQSGNCGDNVTWTLSDDGVLTIEGTGPMSDFRSAPWEDLSVKMAIIKEGVTTIGNNAFYECEDLTSVDIPNSVKSIGVRAFNSCEGLTSVTIPNSVTSIGEFAFYYCKGLTSVTIPDSVTSIEKSLFYNCTGLKSVTISSSVTSIGQTAFCWCSGLKKIKILAETPPDCGRYALDDIDRDSCVVYVPDNSIDAYKDAEVWKEFTNIKGLSGAIQSGTCGDNITWTLDDGVLTLEGTGAMTDYEYSPWDGMDVKKVVIGDGITTIGDYAFIGCTGLTSVEIPNSVTSIGKAAIGNCTGLTSITIPSSVTNIGFSAFNGCTGLEKIVSLAQTPPVCEAYVFCNIDVKKCVLSVPETSIEKYKEADQWKDFYSIVSGIGGVTEESNVGVSASNGVITVTGVAANTVVEVYSISGTLVYRGTSNTVAAPSAGVYVVKVAGKTVKVNAAR